MLSLSVSTLALHIVSALILQLYQEHISGTPLPCQIYRYVMGHILEHQFLFQKQRKIRRKVKKVSFDLFPEICSFWQITLVFMSHSIWQIYHSLTIILSNLLNWLCQASFLLSIMINQYLSKSLNFTRWRRLRLKESKIMMVSLTLR